MELSEYLRFVIALIFVLGLIWALALMVRRFGPGVAQSAMGKGYKKRLKLMEVMPLDARRRVVIFRRDNVEHTVILGANSETLVETNTAPPDEIDVPGENK